MHIGRARAAAAEGDLPSGPGREVDVLRRTTTVDAVESCTGQIQCAARDGENVVDTGRAVYSGDQSRVQHSSAQRGGPSVELRLAVVHRQHAAGLAEGQSDVHAEGLAEVDDTTGNGKSVAGTVVLQVEGIGGIGALVEGAAIDQHGGVAGKLDVLGEILQGGRFHAISCTFSHFDGMNVNRILRSHHVRCDDEETLRTPRIPP